MTGAERSRRARRTTIVGIAGNVALFLVKGVVGALSGSIALVSDAFNSLVDVVASIAIYYSVEVAHREPDADHPFGHHRAEAIAALGVAIFTAILGFEIGRAAVSRLVAGPREIRLAAWAVGALLLSMVGNLLLARFLRSRGETLESPAILANAVECENDIWASLAALVGVGGALLGWPAIDPLAGIVVGAWIVVGGYRFGRQNIDYLMGKSPAGELLEEIRAAAVGVSGVHGAHDVRAHYVGHRVHVEVHVEVDQELTTLESHEVGSRVRRAIEGLGGVDRAFVHVDPVLDSTYVLETLARSQREASAAYAGWARRVAGRPALAALLDALAANAQARAERLGVARRLRGAGWHFADSDVEPDTARRYAEAVHGLRADEGSHDGLPARALEAALTIEDRAALELIHRATRPRDPTLVSSLSAAAPPPPAPGHLAVRLARAREESPSDGERDRLALLAERVARV